MAKSPDQDFVDPSCGPADTVWPIGKKAAFYSWLVIFLLGILDLADRQVLSALLPYLQKEFVLSDTQLGLLISVVNIGLAVFAIPAGYLIDKWSRKKMITLMAGIWSLATGLCAFTNSFAQLLICRAFVGAGEAGYGPAGQSLLVASFPEKYRATVISLVNVGMTLGAPVGLAAGAYVASHWGWRHAFGIFAIPGLLLAFSALLMRDFTKVEKMEKVEDSQGECTQVRADTPSYWIVVRDLITKPTIAFAILAQTVMSIVATALMNWLPLYLVRVGDATPSLAANLAALTMLTNVVYMLIYGVGSDKIRQRFGMHAVLKVMAAFGVLGFIAIFICYQGLAPASTLQIGMVMVYLFFTAGSTLVCMTTIADLSRPDQRATASSLMILMQNIMGMAVGPTLMGILSDRFDLVTAITIISSCALISGVLYYISALTYKRDMAKMETVVARF